MSIHYAVEHGILKAEPELHKVIDPFSVDFEVDWGKKRTAYNAMLYEFIIQPHKDISESFGLEYAVMLVYSPFEEMQPRVMQAISSFFLDDPAKGRVESVVCVIISDDPNAKEWVSQYTIEQQDLRSYVVFSTTQTINQKVIKDGFRDQLRERDLFDVQLPLLDDLYFFGRQSILRDIQDNIRRCENSGLFGLRKTGKTSLLYKIMRTVKELNLGKALLYDAKNAKIRMRSWTELLMLLIDDISKLYGMKVDNIAVSSNIQIVELFETVIKQIPPSERLVLIFDEIEFISFEPIYDKHWEKEFFHFWQLLWTMQSDNRCFCFIIAGVNPKVVEVSSINGAQNPLFSIVKKHYIKGLDRDDIKSMCTKIGKRMGMRIDYTAVNYLYSRYGGHPLLTRLALSYEKQAAKQSTIEITEKTLIDTQTGREEELVPYCQHIVDVLRDYYPNEYLLLQYLSIDDIQDFIDLASSMLSVIHLKNYGLLYYENKVPKIGIPVVSSYIRQGISAEQKSEFARELIPMKERPAWIFNTTKTIIAYMRQLEIAIKKSSSNVLLFGSNSFPEAEKLLEIPVAVDENGFKAFISTFSNCFVESITNYGKSIKKSKYFWSEIKEAYPELFDALLRVKAYRNWVEHLELTQEMQEIVDRYHRGDLEEHKFTEVNDGYYRLQQCTLEKLKLGISLEITRLS